MARMIYRIVACLVLAFAMAAATDALAQKPGEPFADCKGCPEMVVVPAGSFVMGTDGPHEFEKPSRKVTVA